MRKSHLVNAAAMLLCLAAIPARANLLTDGNFSNGTFDFTTGYPAVATNHTVYTTPPAAALITDPSAAFTNGYASYTDHTGDGAALMLFIDGQAGTTVWGETLSLAAFTNYTFSFWGTGAGPSNQADLQLLVNNIANDAGNTLTTVGQWVSYSETFSTGASGNVSLAIIDLNNIAEGNDFTIDDLDLEANGPVLTGVPEPVTLSLFGAGLAGLFAARRRKTKA